MTHILDFIKDTWAVAAVILLGAYMNTIEQRKQARANDVEPDHWLISLTVAGASGVLFGTCAAAIGWEGEKLMAACGIGAYMSLKGVNRIAEKVMGLFPSGRKP